MGPSTSLIPLSSDPLCIPKIENGFGGELVLLIHGAIRVMDAESIRGSVVQVLTPAGGRVGGWAGMRAWVRCFVFLLDTKSL